MADESGPAVASGEAPGGPLKKLFKKINIFALWRHVAAVEQSLGERLDQVNDHSAARLDLAEQQQRTLQDELAGLRDQRATAIEARLDQVEDRTAELEASLVSVEERRDDIEAAQRATLAEVERLRDRVVPAVVDRSDVLLERQAAEVEELASLVERLLLNEPLPTPQAEQPGLSEALDSVQPQLVAAFRGDEEEIAHRLDRYLEPLTGAAPVLDLGCGRGELLLMLREAGVQATGVEADAALVEGARRRGLEVQHGDLLEVLKTQPNHSWGAVSAIHVFEHLPPATLLATLAEIFRVLRPGGLLLAEAPNPGSLRVAASLYWLDPTHQHPLHPETLEVYLRSVGFGTSQVELLNPFPEKQRLQRSVAQNEAEMPEPVRAVQEQLDQLRSRLDELLNGPRDFSLRAVKPTGG